MVKEDAALTPAAATCFDSVRSSWWMGRQPVARRDRWRFIPIVEWLALLRSSLAPRRSRRRDRRRRPDRPEEPRLRRHRRHPAAERSLRRGGGRDPLSDLRHQPPDLDRAELRPGGRGGKCGCRRRRHRHRGRGLVRGDDHARLRRAVPAARGLQDGVDRAVPVAGRGHRLPVRGCDRRRDRRATQADRDRRSPARTRLQELRSWLGHARRHPSRQRCSSAWWRWWWSSGCGRSRHASRARSSWSSADSSASWLFDLGAHGVALVGDVPRGLPTPEVPDHHLLTDHGGTIARRGGRARADRVLADRRRLQDVRGQAPLPDRHQPGIGRAGHGERRRRPVPGDAGVDEPVGELAERPLRRAHRVWRRSRPA